MKTEEEQIAAKATAMERAANGELLGPTDLQAIYGIKHAQFARLKNAGAFDHLRIKPAIGVKSYSGVLVYRHITGQPVYEPTFGRKRVNSVR